MAHKLNTIEKNIFLLFLQLQTFHMCVSLLHLLKMHKDLFNTAILSVHINFERKHVSIQKNPLKVIGLSSHRIVMFLMNNWCSLFFIQPIAEYVRSL